MVVIDLTNLDGFDLFSFHGWERLGRIRRKKGEGEEMEQEREGWWTDVYICLAGTTSFRKTQAPVHIPK